MSYKPYKHSTSLFGGVGIADTYRWEESQYEIDVTVSVPAKTRAKDIAFKATPTSIDLRIEKAGTDGEDIVLIDGSRKVRGRVSIDGTYWAIADLERSNKSDNDDRQVTVTIEKMIVEPQDQFEVMEYDWNGLFPDDEDEVLERKYDEAEELDVREYAQSLGVDIDNINMSMVDKTMFSSGLNMTKSTMDQLSDAGLIE